MEAHIWMQPSRRLQYVRRTLGCNFMRTAAAAKQPLNEQAEQIVSFFLLFTHKVHPDTSDDTIRACKNTVV